MLMNFLRSYIWEKNIMSVDTFNKFRLLIHLICVYCHQEENFHFWGTETYWIEKVVSSSPMQKCLINFSHQTCSGWKNFIFVDFKKKKILRLLYKQFMLGCAQSKKNVQIKSMLPKNHEISSVSGEIILEKDEVFIFYVLK